MTNLLFLDGVRVTKQNYSMKQICQPRQKSSMSLQMKPNIFKCSICDETFALEENLKTHLFDEHLKNDVNHKAFKCEMCDKSFKLRCNLTQHFSRIHENTYRFQCKHCEKDFKFAGNLKRHVRDCHSIDENQEIVKKPHKCNICDKSFPNKSLFMNHISRSHKKTFEFKCDFCEKRFNLQIDLTKRCLFM